MTEKLIKNEQEAIECLKKNKPTSGYYMLQESVDMAIQALEEIQQYRAIGTVEEIIHSNAKALVEQVELEKYKAIGTIEEFKALKEKNTFNKVIDIRKSECPEDIEYFGSDELFGKCPHCEGMVNHTWNPCSCGDCGGLIDWSE